MLKVELSKRFSDQGCSALAYVVKHNLRCWTF